jgi:hypothetical protein
MKYVRWRCLPGLRLKLDYSIKCTSSLLGPLWLHSKLREPAGIRIFTTLRRSLLLALKKIKEISCINNSAYLKENKE